MTINKRPNKYCKASVSPAVKLQHTEGFAFSSYRHDRDKGMSAIK